MKKTMSILLVAMLLILYLTGCGQGGVTTTVAPTPQVPTEWSSETTAPAGPDYGGYSAENPLVLKVAHIGMTENDAQSMVIDLFNGYLTEAVGDSVRLDIYGATALGDDRQILEGTMMGSIDIACNSTSIMASFEPEYEVLDMLYLLSSWNALKAFVQSDVADELGKTFSAQGAMSIGFFATGFRSIGSNGRGITTPADLAGMKIRVIGSDVMMNGFRALGANPITLSGSEIVPAMESGTVDAFETVESVFYTNGYECMDYISLTKHTAMFNSINFNKAKFDSLTPDLQQAILDAATQACLTYTEDVEARTDKYLHMAEKERGITVYYDEDMNIDAFRELYQPIIDEAIASGKFAYLEAILALN